MLGDFKDKILFSCCLAFCVLIYLLDTSFSVNYGFTNLYTVVILIASLSRKNKLIFIFLIACAALIIIEAFSSPYNNGESVQILIVRRVLRISILAVIAFLTYKFKKTLELQHAAEYLLQQKNKQLELSKYAALSMMEDTKIAAQVTQQAEKKFKMVVESAPNGIIVVDKQGKIELANSMVEKLFGYTQSELIGEPVDKLIPERFKSQDPEYRRKFFLYRQVRSSGIGKELYGLRKDKSEFPFEAGINPIETDQGIKFLASIVDITERKLAEEVLKRDNEGLEKLVSARSKELLKAQDALKQANRLADIGTLAATVAHELRNPLGVIQMAVYNLQRKYKSFEGKEHLVNIEKKVWEGNMIIDNLLSYSSIKNPSYEKVDLFNLLSDCESVVQSRFQNYDVTIDKQYGKGDLQEIEIDPHQMKEVFLNILNNAFQAFPEKKGTIQIIVKSEQDNFVDILFKDNGTGIDEGDLDKVFVPFFTRKSKGTGLGLAICNELVNLHHGKIEIQSRKGAGTTVRIIIPRYVQ